MAITLKQLRIRNFRSCADIELSFSRYTALIGYNNSGKSNILDSIVWLLRRYTLAEKDFFDTSKPVEVEAIFSDIVQEDIDLLPENQKRQIEPYISNSTLRARRLQPMPNAKSADCKVELYDPKKSDWRPNPSGIDAALSALFPEPIVVGAMEDAAEDSAKSKTTTTIGKLLAELTGSIQSFHAKEINEHLSQVSERLSSSGKSRISQLSSIDEKINEKLLEVFSGISIKLHFDVPALADLIKAGTIKVAEGADLQRDISSFGHGTQRAIQVALIRHLAELRRSNAVGGTTLLLIDEPELYLHPFAIEQVRAALKALSNSGYQVIFSTHSAQMIEAVDAQNAILVRKNFDGSTASRKRLRDAILNLVTDSEPQLEILFALSNANEILFSDYVVLVEGKTEKRLLPYFFQNIKGQSLGQNRIALVAIDGVANLKKTMSILCEMDLPTKAIVDLDYAFIGAINDGLIQREDEDIKALKLELERLETQFELTLDGSTRLPINGPQGRASAGYEVLASQETSKPHIDNLHNKLLPFGIWLWTKGAFEAHLGISGKKEKDWAQYIELTSKVGFNTACSNDSKAVQVIDWIQEST